MEKRARYKVAGPIGQLAEIVDSTLRRLDTVGEKLVDAQLEPAKLENCITELEEITRLLGDSVREAANARRAYA